MAQDKKQEKPSPPGPAWRWRRQWALGIGVVVAAAAAVGYFTYRAVAYLPGTPMPDLGNLHILTPEEPHTPYNSEPPTSGPHLPYLAPWGIHTEPISKELQVHNLEDGGVMVQYNCPTGCALSFPDEPRRYPCVRMLELTWSSVPPLRPSWTNTVKATTASPSSTASPSRPQSA